MKSKPLFLLVLLIALLGIAFLFNEAPATAAPESSLPTAVPYLVKNVEPFDVSWTPGPDPFVEMNGILYFAGNDGTHGFELWRSDGTTEGTYMVKDIRSGAESSTPTDLTVLHGILYFTADDGTHGYELWRSDGTTAGTDMVKDINPGEQGADIYGLTLFNNQLIFAADDGTHGYEPWRSDGTEAGTYMIHDITPGTESSYPNPLVHLNQALLFEAHTAGGDVHLWRTNGTSAGTTLVKEIHPAHNSVVLNHIAYFKGQDGAGWGLWRSDGTPAGTYEVSPPTHTSDPYNLTAVGNTLFFAAYGDGVGTELWKSDGTLAGTVLVKDIREGSGGSVPSGLTAVDDLLFFSANDDTHGNELWKSDGTEAGTVLVKNITDSNGSSSPSNLTVAHGRLYFAAGTMDTGAELWQSDGTDEGTVRLTDINPGIFHSHPKSLLAIGDRLFFNATDGAGEKLWAVADPQTGPTFVVNNRSDADNGTCTLGHCSLREAINAANGNPGPDTITFAATAHGTITPNTAFPTITEALTINGPGLGNLIINGGFVTHQPLLRVNAGNFSLNSLTIWQGGSASTPSGGALLADGSAQPTLNQVRFNQNKASLGGAVAFYNGGTLFNVEFDGNEATSGNGGALIAYNGTVTMYNSSFTNNSAVGNGGAIYMQGNLLNVATSYFGNNTAVNGGAIAGEVRPTIDRSRFNGNQASNHGGAIYTNPVGNFLTVYNSLFTGNTAVGEGTAVHIATNGSALNHTLIHNTFAAPERMAGTAVHMAATGTLNLTNNIIANNHTGIARAAGTVNEDYNLFYDNEVDRDNLATGADSATGNPLFISAEHDLYDLLPGSPAVDAGTATAVNKDIYNNDRPQGTAVDKGFFELPQTAVTGPGGYAIADTGVSITVTQAGDLANVQLVWVPLDHPSYDEEGEENHPASTGGYWKIVGINSAGTTATGFSLTLTLPYPSYETDPTVCRWDGAAWDCARDGFDSTRVWRHSVTAFSEWAVGEYDDPIIVPPPPPPPPPAEGEAIFLPLITR